MSSNFPLLTPEMANHLEVCSTSFSVKKQEALRSLPGNPYKAEIRTFGNATALLAQKTHNSELFNRVGNMSAADLPYLDAIIEWYHIHGVSCSFDIVPSSASPELLWGLASKGFYQSGFYNVLYGLPQTELTHDSDITVRAASLEEKDVFAEVYLDSFEVPKTEVYAYVYDSIRVLVGKPAIHCLFALINNTVASIAILHIYQQTGYLALSATLPSFRGHGCQKALLRARITMAATAGCKLIVGQAGVTTISQQNMEKLGLLTTKAIWTQYDQQRCSDQEIDPLNK